VAGLYVIDLGGTDGVHLELADQLVEAIDQGQVDGDVFPHARIREAPGDVHLATIRGEGEFLRERRVVILRVEELLDPAKSHSTCYLRVPDVDGLHREFASAGLPTGGIPRLTSPKTKPWGVREFHLVDPSGNCIRVGQELKSPVGEVST
jgi:hypothetical protein